LRSEKETAVGTKLSSDVAELAGFEQSLLKNYQMYLQRLHKVIKQHDAGRGDVSAVARRRKGR
jgi:flagellar biosynthesis chaperone FliJ